MQVVELGERGEAALQHLHHREGRDGLDVVRRERSEEAVHHLPPGPEAVPFRPARLGKPRHAALEGVAVQVRQTRQRDAGDALAAFGGGIRLDRGNRAVLDVEPDIPGPAVGQGGHDRE